MCNLKKSIPRQFDRISPNKFHEQPMGIIIRLNVLALSALLMFAASAVNAQKMPQDMKIEDFPLSKCFDKNNWAWYQRWEGQRYAKCDLHKNTHGQVLSVKMHISDYSDTAIQLSGKAVSDQLLGTDYTRIYARLRLCYVDTNEFYNETRVLSSQCIDKILKHKESRERLFALHGIRSTYAERKKHGKGVKMTVEKGYDRYGSDYKWLENSTAKKCLVECKEDKQCKAYTYVDTPVNNSPKGRCYLKNHSPSKTPMKQVTSGIKQ
jgi:hypothetical protein